MISKNKIYQVAKEFKNLENNYMMGIIYDTYKKDIRVDLIVSDLLNGAEVVIVDYNSNLKTIKNIVHRIQNQII